MRYRANHREEARAKLLEAAGRGFRRRGYGGIGVDGLAKEGGVTSGAFYGHFKSKDEAFAAAAVAGLEALRDAVTDLRARLGPLWLDAFIDFYLGERVTCALEESCALQSMTPDVMRAPEAIRSSYEAALNEVAGVIAAGLYGTEEETRIRTAWSLMALLSGGVTMARSVASADARAGIVANLAHAARSIAGTPSTAT